jgi:hypothetical protein
MIVVTPPEDHGVPHTMLKSKCPYLARNQQELWALCACLRPRELCFSAHDGLVLSRVVPTIAENSQRDAVLWHPKIKVARPWITTISIVLEVRDNEHSLMCPTDHANDSTVDNDETERKRS